MTSKAATKDFDPRPRWLRWEAQPWSAATAEQLHYIAREMLSGDPLSVLGLTHAGSPDRVDQAGDTKAALRDLIGDGQAFESIANALSYPGGKLAWLASTRRPLRQKSKVRNIDIPSEKMRLAQQAKMLLNLIPLVFERDALDPRAIGFRKRYEFETFAKRKDGITIQDVFASTMFVLVQEHGPFILLIDLADAYGNLPHKAVKVALKELLGLKGWQAREVVELARVRTRLGDSRLHKPNDYGIEQGSPIAPLLFNLVQTLVARRLHKQGFESGCFGDDIGIATQTKAGAEMAFEVYKQILIDLGFRAGVVRDLDDDKEAKASHVYDTRWEPVPLIKTYLVTTHEIGLTPEKAWELISRLPLGASLNEMRHRNRWKAASKSYLRRLLTESRSRRASARLQAEGVMVKGAPQATCSVNLIVPPGVDPDPDLPGDGEPEGEPEVGTTSSGTRSTAMPTGTGSCSCTQGDDVEGCDPLCSYPYPDSASMESPKVECQLGAGETAQDQPKGQGAGRPSDGKDAVLRDGPGADFPIGENEGEVQGHQASPSASVSILPLDRGDIADLGEGRRLRAGDRYRPDAHLEMGEAARRTMLDLRGTASSVPAWRLSWAAKQLVRVTSVAGRSELLIEPAGAWYFALVALDSDGYRVSVREASAGLIVTVWKRPPGEAKHRRVVEPAPPTELVLSLRRSTNDVRHWKVRLERAGEVEHMAAKVRSFNPLIGKIEALSQVVVAGDATHIAVKDAGGIQRLLSDDVLPRQVDLAMAVRLLDGVWARQVSPTWLLLELSGE